MNIKHRYHNSNKEYTDIDIYIDDEMVGIVRVPTNKINDLNRIIHGVVFEDDYIVSTGRIWPDAGSDGP
jgi:hypothetical protein